MVSKPESEPRPAELGGLHLEDLRVPPPAPPRVASALCGGSLHLLTPHPCGEGSSCSGASTDLTAPSFLGLGIHSWSQLPTAAGYILKYKPRDQAGSVAGASAGAALQSWEGPREGFSGRQALPPPLSHPPPPLFLSSWSSSWLWSVRFVEILPVKLGGQGSCCKEVSKGQEYCKRKAQNPSPGATGCLPSTFSCRNNSNKNNHVNIATM